MPLPGDHSIADSLRLYHQFSGDSLNRIPSQLLGMMGISYGPLWRGRLYIHDILNEPLPHIYGSLCYKARMSNRFERDEVLVSKSFPNFINIKSFRTFFGFFIFVLRKTP